MKMPTEAPLGFDLVWLNSKGWGFTGWLEAVADPGLSDNVMRSVFELYLLADLPNQHTQAFRLSGSVRGPDCGNQLLMSNDAAWVLREIDQKLELLESKSDFSVPNRGPERISVDAKIANINASQHSFLVPKFPVSVAPIAYQPA
jgi:hypothetical protein